jgi:uncharacterized metal-binding protein YceD (DUF177 family)
MTSQTQPPFSRPFEVAQAETLARTVDLEASAAECAALAKDMDVVAIGALKAQLTVTAAPKGQFIVTGRVKGRVTQTCVVSLDPFETEVDEEVEVTFAPPEEVERQEAAYAERREEDPTGLDWPEPPDAIDNGRIDLALVAAEFLALSLDPYPRKPGAEFALPPELTPAEEEKASPFAALAKLKKQPGTE